MSPMASDDRPGFSDRLSAMRAGFTATRKADRKFLPLVIGVPLVVAAVVVVATLLLGLHPALAAVLGVLFALLVALAVFGRRASAAQVAAIEGQPGAAAAILNAMRGAWIVTPAVAFTRKQDFVHRAVGPPGIVLVGEGAPSRVAQMLKQEKRKLTKVAGPAAVHEVSVGTAEGQIALSGLQRHLMRLPRSIKPKQVGPLNTRLTAVQQPDVPLPKGPMPTSRKQR